MAAGLDEMKSIEKSVRAGNIMGIVVGSIGIIAIGLTIYSMSLSIKVNKLNIKKLNKEGIS